MGAISAAAVQSSSNRWHCALLQHARLPESQESTEFSLPGEHPACTGGAGATEEEVSDLGRVTSHRNRMEREIRWARLPQAG